MIARKNCPRCHGTGLEVIDHAKDGSAILDDCRDCKEYERDRLEAQAEDAAAARREEARERDEEAKREAQPSDEPRERFEGGPRPPHYVPPLGMTPGYDGLD
jgi:hypothetical protein